MICFYCNNVRNYAMFVRSQLGFPFAPDQADRGESVGQKSELNESIYLQRAS